VTQIGATKSGPCPTEGLQTLAYHGLGSGLPLESRISSGGDPFGRAIVFERANRFRSSAAPMGLGDVYSKDVRRGSSEKSGKRAYLTGMAMSGRNEREAVNEREGLVEMCKQ
jgi:hypothetical protein